ncbi:hypothetical protein [Marinobacter salicampi]|uniref:hypothetical protein n=1 Tax=Marinobacter salicampi TaxID=435907 RepID=UPI00140CFE55|nr:hypothetical protein [Marinobacter salicampi]
MNRFAFAMVFCLTGLSSVSWVGALYPEPTSYVAYLVPEDDSSADNRCILGRTLGC